MFRLVDMNKFDPSKFISYDNDGFGSTIVIPHGIHLSAHEVEDVQKAYYDSVGRSMLQYINSNIRVSPEEEYVTEVLFNILSGNRVPPTSFCPMKSNNPKITEHTRKIKQLCKNLKINESHVLKLCVI